MTDKPSGGAAQMTGPDKIWASKSCTVYMDGSSPLQASTRPFHRAEEYTRTAAHPVTVEALKRWADLAEGAYPDYFEAEIRAAIAQIEASK